MIKRTIELLDWQILHTLGDGYESVERISGSLYDNFDLDEVPRDKIISSLEWMHEGTYVFLINNKHFDRDALEAEQNHDLRIYWFGRTEKGYKTYEHYHSEFENTFYQPPDEEE